MNRIYYLPLEAYKARYTEQLSSKGGWVESAFSPHFTDLVPLRPESTAQDDILSGKVLDKIKRPVWSMQQMAMLLQQPYADLGKVYFDDFYTSGLDALPYSGKKFKAYAFNWAQTFDVYDFTHKEMFTDMRAFECMAASIYSKVFVACPMLAELMQVVFGPQYPVEAVGLPFNSHMVAQQIDPSFQSDRFDLVYSSRFDKEKNPGFFLDLVARTGVRAAICTGHPSLRGDDTEAVKRAETMSEKGQLTIYTDMTKGKYYSVLFNSTVQFNCALQDWVSFTLLEALTFGCKPLYPNWRAMPATLMYSADNLYIPGELEDAEIKLGELLNNAREEFPFRKMILDYHNGALTRIAKSIKDD